MIKSIKLTDRRGAEVGTVEVHTGQDGTAMFLMVELGDGEAATSTLSLEFDRVQAQELATAIGAAIHDVDETLKEAAGNPEAELSVAF